MSTARDAAMSHYEQDNYDPDESADSGRCGECDKKYKNCKCPDNSPVIGDFVCQTCGAAFSEEWSGNDELHKECAVCHHKRIYPNGHSDAQTGDDVIPY